MAVFVKPFGKDYDQTAPKFVRFWPFWLHYYDNPSKYVFFGTDNKEHISNSSDDINAKFDKSLL